MQNKRAFTLVELLVVIAIIGVLIATLLPAIAKAKFSAQETVCITRIRVQYAALAGYGIDFRDRFPEHLDPYAMYVKAPYNNTNNMNVWAAMGPFNPVTLKRRDSYINNGKLLLCPLESGFGGSYEDTTWIQNFSGVYYGGWHSTTANYAYIAYEWFANYKPNLSSTIGSFGTNTFLNGEPAWPNKLSDGNSQGAIITHQVYQDSSVIGWDLSHGMPGTKRFAASTAYTGGNMPIGFGDGHVIIRAARDILARVQSVHGGRTITYWY